MCLISRYCDLLKIKIFYVYIELFRTIILTSSPSITNTFKRIITTKCLCKVLFWFLVNILRKQDEAEWAFDSTQKPSVVCNQLWVKGLGRYACDMDWHPRYWVSLMITEIALKMVRTCCLSSWHICYPKKVYWIRCCEGFSVEWFLLGCDTMHICRKSLKFQRNMMHIVSAMKMVVAHFHLSTVQMLYCTDWCWNNCDHFLCFLVLMVLGMETES